MRGSGVGTESRPRTGSSCQGNTTPFGIRDENKCLNTAVAPIDVIPSTARDLQPQASRYSWAAPYCSLCPRLRGVRDDRSERGLSFRPKGEIFHAHVDGGWPLGLTLSHAASDRTQPPPPRRRAVAMTFDIWSTKRRSGKLQPCVGRGLGIRGLSLVSSRLIPSH